MNKENIAYIHSGSVLTKEQTDMIYKLAEKPIKIIFEDVTEVNMNGYDIEIKGRLSGIEAEKVISNIFGTTYIGILDCSNIKEDLYYCPTCQRVLDLTEIDSCMNTPNEIIDYCLECQSEVINLKDM